MRGTWHITSPLSEKGGDASPTQLRPWFDLCGDY